MTNKTYKKNTIEFDKCNERGSQTEELLYKILIRDKKNGLVCDTRNNAFHISIDTDFIIRRLDNIRELIRIECKSDSVIHKYNNFFIEFEGTSKYTNSHCIGWYQIIEADYIYYYNEYEQFFYVFKVADLKEYVEANKDKLKIGKHDESEGNKIMKGYLVSIKKFAAKYSVYILNKKGEWV